MKRGRNLGIFLLIISLMLISSVFGYDSGVVTFSSVNAPLNYPPRFSDPNYQCIDGQGSGGGNNGAFPMQISSNSKFSVGEKLKVINPRGNVCDRVYSGGCDCKACGCRNCGSTCADGTLYDYNSDKVRIGFYRSNAMGTSPIAEYPLRSFIGNGIAIPAGTNYIYAYFAEGLDAYWDNSLGVKMTFNYETGIACTPKTCSNYPGQCGSALNDGCGGTINCASACGGLTCGPAGLCITTHSCSSSSQTIMKLSDWNNALGGFWDSTFTYDICYNELFGKEFTNGTIHPLGCSSPVLWLNSSTNAYASTFPTAKYNLPICFGNMICRSDNSSCASDEKTVLKLSSLTDALISNATSSGAVQICCKLQTTTAANWTNMKEAVISKADLNDSVKLIVFGVGIGNVNYTIYKDGTYWWNKDQVISQTSTKGYLVWQAKNSGTYYFKAQVEGDSNWKQSNNMVVSSSENNFKPTIKIIKPARETTYIIDSTTGSTASIIFEQTSSDEDDDLNVTWDFGEGYNSSTFSNCITTRNCNTTYAYSSSGTKLIKATAKEMSRSQSTIDNSRIFVYKEGLNIFAIIDSPDYKTIIQEIGNYFVDGRSSHVANCSFDLNKCTAGALPKTCYTITDSVSSQKIYCYKFAESSDNRFGFKWTIENKVDTEHTNFRYFNRSFVIPKDYPINLKVNFTF